MVSANDPVESFLNSIQGFRDAFTPLESSIKKAAKDLEYSWLNSIGVCDDAELLQKGYVGYGVVGNGPKCNGNKRQMWNLKKRTGHSDNRKKGLMFKVPVKTFLGMFSLNGGSNDDGSTDGTSEVKKEVGLKKDDGSCVNCLQFAMTWSLLLSGFVQAFPSPFRGGTKKRCQRKLEDEDKVLSSVVARNTCKPVIFYELKEKDLRKGESFVAFREASRTSDKENHKSLESLFTVICDQLSNNLKKLYEGHDFKKPDTEVSNKLSSNPSPPFPFSASFDHFKVLANIIEGKREEMNGFLGNLNFARMGGTPSTLVGVTSPVIEDDGDSPTSSQGENGDVSVQKISGGLFSIPLSNVERIKSTISTISITELIELVQQLGRSGKDVPDKKKLFSVQDFFRYTEAEGKRFFEELDRDGDGQVNLEDLEIAMRRRRLPQKYAKELMNHTRSHMFSKSFGWKQFLTLMEQREPTILRAYTSLCLSKSGTLQKSEILASLKNAGLPTDDDHAVAMMRFLTADVDGSISYGHFRNFMLLLPSDKMQDDPRNVWFEAATVVAVPPPVEIPASSVLRSALAGGLSCALSTSLMHPVDTVKTRVQASALSFPDVISRLPEIGVRALYRGSIPAILGQFTSHGLRTGIFEATKLVLVNVAPTLPDIQVQSIASFCSTLLGTATRIPNEVLKQRLQAGLHNNAKEAIVAIWQQDGLKGFFRGTGATLCREVPFYVAGMGLYAESKKLVRHLLGRDLEPWETIVVGAVSGGLAAVTTTPFDVIKTRMMTAPSGRHITTTMVAYSILRHEGPLGLFKGAVPRFFWIAPLGAMNFAGYELAKKAMMKKDGLETEKLTN